MYEVIFLLILALIWIIFASIQDLRSREVADWLNFSLIIFALGFRFFYSLFSENFSFFYQGLIGLGIFFVLGNLFYYSRVFAGGDAKLMISLGAILPIYETFSDNLKIFFFFFLIILFVGLVYTIIWSIFLATRNLKGFKKEFKACFNKNKNITYLAMFFGLILVVLTFIDIYFLFFGIIIFSFPYVYFYATSVDESCMIKRIKPKDLTEGDWLYRDVKAGKKLIKANWEGLTKKEIQLIQKLHKNVLIRQGIPFVPVFLISFIILLGFLNYYNIGFLRFLGDSSW
ncbi:MAG: A24 family peptidase [Nanoarchaeota archaeon]